jgi:3-hydroxyacyl-[acyl-carrier-protein] dehydratase
MFEQADLRGLLRQRHPMLLLDRVIDVSPPSSIVAVKAVTAAEPCYAHLADAAGVVSFEYPLALLVESFGQAVAVLWTLGRSGARDGVPLLASLQDVVVEAAAVPGDLLEHHVRLERVTGDAAMFSGRTCSAGRPVLRVGSMLVVNRPPGNLLPDHPAPLDDKEISR